MSRRPDIERDRAQRWSDDTPAQGSLAEYWHAIYRRRWLVLIITAGVMLAALAVSLMITPQYRATTTLQIEREVLNVVNLENLIPSETPMDRDFYQTQYELLMSRSLARKVIRRTQLAQDPQYADTVQAVSAAFDARAAGERGAALRQTAIEGALVDPVLAALQIEPVRNSRLVRIHFESPPAAVRARGQCLCAGIHYCKPGTPARGVDVRAQVPFGSPGPDPAAARGFGEALRRIRRTGADRLGRRRQASLPAQNLAELNATLATAQNARIKAEAAWRASERGNGTTLPQVMSNPLVQSLLQTRANSARTTSRSCRRTSRTIRKCSASAARSRRAAARSPPKRPRSALRSSPSTPPRAAKSRCSSSASTSSRTTNWICRIAASVTTCSSARSTQPAALRRAVAAVQGDRRRRQCRRQQHHGRRSGGRAVAQVLTAHRHQPHAGDPVRPVRRTRHRLAAAFFARAPLIRDRTKTACMPRLVASSMREQALHGRDTRSRATTCADVIAYRRCERAHSRSV